MSPSDFADADSVTLPSAHRASETVDRLTSLLRQKKIEVFADIDHAAGAQTVGLSLRPTRVLIFGNERRESWISIYLAEKQWSRVAALELERALRKDWRKKARPSSSTDEMRKKRSASWRILKRREARP